MKLISSLFSFASLSLALACQTSVPTEPPDPEPIGPLTYYRDIVPLMNEACNNCHNQGGIGPFTLTSYQDVVSNIDSVLFETQSRRMPPWHINNSGSCQTYQEARELSQAQIDMLTQWADEGMLEGDPADAPAPVTAEKLDRVDRTLIMETAYTPRLNVTDDYRCFLVDPQLATDAFLTAYEVKPGVTAEVHHIILFGLTDDQMSAKAEQLDAQDPQPGYTCFGDSRVDALPVAAWAPGVNVQKFPEGSGVLLKGGRKLVMQVHYNTLAGVQPDQTAIDLKIEAGVPSQAFIAGAGDFDLVLAPGESSVSTTEDFVLDFLPFPVQVHGVYPHMHTLGRTLHFEVIRADGSDSECLAQVDDWDFNWQQFYFYDTPITVNPGDTLRVTCSYDTTSRSEPVVFGEGTQDEMCIAGVYITL